MHYLRFYQTILTYVAPKSSALSREAGLGRASPARAADIQREGLTLTTWLSHRPGQGRALLALGCKARPWLASDAADPAAVMHGLLPCL
jgi:hypothetical protein